MHKTIEEILKAVPQFEADGRYWYPLQEISIALGVAPQKITKFLPAAEKVRRTIGQWPMKQSQYGISPQGLITVWRVYGRTGQPIHLLKMAVR